MIKRLSVVLLVAIMVALMYPQPWAADTTRANTILGTGVVYPLTGEEKGELFGLFYGGRRLFELPVFVVAEYADESGGGTGGFGAALMFAQPIHFYDRLYLLGDLGAINNLARDADGSYTWGATSGVGLSWAATEDMSLDGWVRWWDTGEEFNATIAGGIHWRNPDRVLSPIFKVVGGVVGGVGDVFTFIGDLF